MKLYKSTFAGDERISKLSFIEDSTIEELDAELYDEVVKLNDWHAEVSTSILDGDGSIAAVTLLIAKKMTK